MRPQQQVLSAAGFAPWVPVDYRGTQFGVGIGVSLSNSASLTYSVQHSFDDPEKKQKVSIARVTTTATVTFKEAHGLVVDDSINVVGTREDNLSGVFAVASVPSATTLTYTVANTGSTAEECECVVFSVFNNDDLNAQTASGDGNYAFPPTVIRLNVTSYTSGSAKANYNFLSR